MDWNRGGLPRFVLKRNGSAAIPTPKKGRSPLPRLAPRPRDFLTSQQLSILPRPLPDFERLATDDVDFIPQVTGGSQGQLAPVFRKEIRGGSWDVGRSA